MQSLRQDQRQTQSTLIAPQMRESLKVLQVSAFELRNTILDELQTNPSLEEMPAGDVSLEAREHDDSPYANDNTDSSSDDASEAKELDFENGQLDALRQLDEDWREYYSEENALGGRYSEESQAKRQHFFDSFVAESSLEEHLMSQAQMVDADDPTIETLRYLVGCLDEQGFLPLSTKEIAHTLGSPIEQVEQALDILKNLDPPGIGCRDIKDSLLFQLSLRDRADSRAALIVRDHYDLLLRRRIPELAAKLGVSKALIQESLEEIAQLDPVPARNFRTDDNHDVLPDVIVRKQMGEWSVDLNSDHIPRLRISKAYKELMMRDRLSEKEREYLRDKMKSGKFLINAIEQRQSTLMRISKLLVECQAAFFERGVSALKPMTMSELAEKLGLHETTISRAIANKYMATPFGVFALKYFFTAGYTSEAGESISNTTVKDKIAEIISKEDLHKPFSDQKIADMLAGQKIAIARRTVAKYREELGILPTSMRRVY